jgi:very-short-patch-repair endonuclease
MKCESVKCENSLSLLQEKNGQRFCCRSCSNSAIKRLNSLESRLKVSAKLKLVKPFANPSIIKTCPVCSKEFTVTFGNRNQKTCSFKCGKKLGGKNAAKTMAKNGTHSGWHNRKGEPSYPEKYFISLFENENITGWIREKKVGRWFIDFAFEDRHLAVEIDGRQHLDEERKKSDIAKDEYLSSDGWSIVRIPWSNPMTEKGRKNLYPHIERLKSLLKEHYV